MSRLAPWQADAAAVVLWLAENFWVRCPTCDGPGVVDYVQHTAVPCSSCSGTKRRATSPLCSA